MASEVPDKTCAICGRRFSWRRRWADNWEQVRYCSARCRGRRLAEDDRRLELAIAELLRARGRGKSICPSEAARQVFPERWREQMERTREAARRLAAAGELVFTQRGRVVDPSRARGAVRLAVPPR